jgi:hypothetical protein
VNNYCYSKPLLENYQPHLKSHHSFLSFLRCYATATNKMRNTITASTFKEHILKTHPTVEDSSKDPPQHTLMIEACIMKKSENGYNKISPVRSTNL